MLECSFYNLSDTETILSYPSLWPQAAFWNILYVKVSIKRLTFSFALINYLMETEKKAKYIFSLYFYLFS